MVEPVEEKIKELEVLLEDCKSSREKEKDTQLADCEKNKSLLEARALKLTVGAAVGGTIVGKDVLDEIITLVGKLQEFIASIGKPPGAYAQTTAGEIKPITQTWEELQWDQNKPVLNRENYFAGTPPIPPDLADKKDFFQPEWFWGSEINSNSKGEIQFSDFQQSQNLIELAEAMPRQTVNEQAPEQIVQAFVPDQILQPVVPVTAQSPEQPNPQDPQMAVVPEPSMAVVAMMGVMMIPPRKRF